MRYVKYHALGNDYLVIEPGGRRGDLSKDRVRLICHRNYGVGSDGILVGPLPSEKCDFRLRIYNPDGSEAEKSGNGLRIFSRFLWDEGLLRHQPFTIETLGGPVTSSVDSSGRSVTVEMGAVRFDSQLIPVIGPRREVINEQIEVGGETLSFCAATIGNPHCVILCSSPSEALARRFGPLIEVHPLFPNRTNVQFMEVIDRRNIRIEIWERGAGYTLASGSSSTAAAGVAHRLNLCERDLTVHMPGGRLQISFNEGFTATMKGPVVRICAGEIDAEAFEKGLRTSARISDWRKRPAERGRV
jgi:diaminopimelate epimerase